MELPSLSQICPESFVLKLAKQFVLNIFAFPLTSPLEKEPQRYGLQELSPYQCVTCPRRVQAAGGSTNWLWPLEGPRDPGTQSESHRSPRGQSSPDRSGHLPPLKGKWAIHYGFSSMKWVITKRRASMHAPEKHGLPSAQFFFLARRIKTLPAGKPEQVR